MLTTSEIEPAAFRETMSRFAAAVHIITTDGSAGRRGVTATSVCAVSDEPATLLVCLNTSNPANERYEANGCFAVNLLAGRNEPLARVFAGEGNLGQAERFASGQWTSLTTGAPILLGSLAGFDCRITDARIVATHHVLIGEVVGLRLGAPDAGLLYHGREYHRI